MKTRAGLVGAGGVASVLSQARRENPDLPMHLVGHSFGGRLVTAAAASFPKRDTRVSLVLLQAAFSHNGLAAKYDGKHDGAFRTVLSDVRVNGPVVITHTKNDQAVGVAYPLASRIARDRSSAVGDQDDPYGGMGRNGAQHTPEVERSEAVLREAGSGLSYAFKVNRVFNLLADKTISNHSDVRNKSVATALRDVVCLP
jgi:thioesterase domain-containing protein